MIGELSPGDIVFISGLGPLSRGIETVEHSKYSHVALYTGYDDPEKQLIEAQGFRRVGYQRLDAYAGRMPVDVYRYKLRLTYPERKRIIRSAEKHIGQHYDYLLIGIEFVRYAFGVMIPYYEHNSVICSTLIADAYRATGITLCSGKWLPSPADEAQSPELERVMSL